MKIKAISTKSCFDSQNLSLYIFHQLVGFYYWQRQLFLFPTWTMSQWPIQPSTSWAPESQPIHAQGKIWLNSFCCSCLKITFYLLFSAWHKRCSCNQVHPERFLEQNSNRKLDYRDWASEKVESWPHCTAEGFWSKWRLEKYCAQQYKHLAQVWTPTPPTPFLRPPSPFLPLLPFLHVAFLCLLQWDDQFIFLIMEYCSGGDLSRFIQSRRALPEEVARKFLRQLGTSFLACQFSWRGLINSIPAFYRCLESGAKPKRRTRSARGAAIHAKTVETLELSEHYSYPPSPFSMLEKCVKSRRSYAALKQHWAGGGGVSTHFGADCGKK